MKWQPLQNSGLESPMDRGAWQTTSMWSQESDMTQEINQRRI